MKIESAKKGKPNSFEMYFVLSYTEAIRVNVNNYMRYLFAKQNQYRICTTNRYCVCDCSMGLGYGHWVSLTVSTKTCDVADMEDGSDTQERKELEVRDVTLYTSSRTTGCQTLIIMRSREKTNYTTRLVLDCLCVVVLYIQHEYLIPWYLFTF